MKRRPQEWQTRKAATAKGLRALPACATPGCEGRAVGVLMGSDLCPRCQQTVQRAQREKRQNET